MVKVEAIAISLMIQDIRKVHILGLQATQQQDLTDTLQVTVGQDMDTMDHRTQADILMLVDLEAVSIFQCPARMGMDTIQIITATQTE